MPAVRGAFNKEIAPGARKAFADEYKELPAEYTDIFNIETSSKAYEEDLVATGLGVAVEKPETVEVALDVPKHRGSVKYTHLTYGLGYEVSQELVEDDLYGVVTKPSSKYLARSLREAEETLAFNVINLAATTQQAYDGVSLLNASHPIVGGGTLANRPAADVDLSITALQQSVERYMSLTTDRGIKIVMQPAILAVPIQNFWLANEILRSEFKPFTANNEINVLRQMGMTPVEFRHITDTDSWYTIAPKGQHKLNFFWRRKPQFDDDYDKKRQIALMMITARFIAGVTDWRGIDGSIGI
jgi:phage major head subunit gpT-like protein